MRRDTILCPPSLNNLTEPDASGSVKLFKEYCTIFFFSAPCLAGNFETADGCQKCEKNTYSGDGATKCTSCPDGKISDAESKSESECEYGET